MLTQSQLKKILFSVKREEKRKKRQHVKMEKKKEADYEIIDLCSDSENSVENENGEKSKGELGFGDTFVPCLTGKTGNDDVGENGMDILSDLYSGCGNPSQTGGHERIKDRESDYFNVSCSNGSYLNLLQAVLKKQPESSSSGIDRNEFVQQDLAFVLGIYENQPDPLLSIDRNQITEENADMFKNYDSAENSEDESWDEEEEYSYYWIPDRDYLEKLNQIEDFTQDSFENCSNFSCYSHSNSELKFLGEEKIEDIQPVNAFNERRLEGIPNLSTELDTNFEEERLFRNGCSDFSGIAISQEKPIVHRSGSPIHFQIQPKAHSSPLKEGIGKEMDSKNEKKNDIPSVKKEVLVAKIKIEKMLEERRKNKGISIKKLKNEIKQSKCIQKIKKISTLENPERNSRNRKNSGQGVEKEEGSKKENSRNITKKRKGSEGDGNLNKIENLQKKYGAKDKNVNYPLPDLSFSFYSEEEEEVGEVKDLKEIRKEVLEARRKIEKSIDLEKRKVKKILKEKIFKNKIEQSKLMLSQKIEKMLTLENPVENLEENRLEKAKENDLSSNSEKSGKETDLELPSMLKLVPYSGSSPVLVTYSDSSGDEKEKESKIVTEWEGLTVEKVIPENEKGSSFSMSSNRSFSPGKKDTEGSGRWRKRRRKGSERCEEGEIVSDSDYSEISETELPRSPKFPRCRRNTFRSRYSSIGSSSFSSSTKTRSPSPRERILLTRPSRSCMPRGERGKAFVGSSELSSRDEKGEDLLINAFATSEHVKSPRSRHRRNGRSRGTSKGRYSRYGIRRPEEKEPSARNSESRKSIKRLIETKKSTLEKQKRSISPEAKPRRKSRFDYDSLPKAYSYSANPNAIITPLPKKKKDWEDLLKDMEMGKPEEDPGLINENDYDWDITPERQQTPSPEHGFVMIRGEKEGKENTPVPKNVEPEMEKLEESVSSPEEILSGNACSVAVTAPEALVEPEQIGNEDQKEDEREALDEREAEDKIEDKIEKEVGRLAPPIPEMGKGKESDSKYEVSVTNDPLETFSKYPPLIGKLPVMGPMPEKEEEKVKRLEHIYLNIQKQVEEFQMELNSLKSRNAIEFPLPKILNDSPELLEGKKSRSPSPQMEKNRQSPKSEDLSERNLRREDKDGDVKSKETETETGSKRIRNRKQKRSKNKSRAKRRRKGREKRKREAEEREKKETEKRKRMEREIDMEIEKQRQIQRKWEKEIEREQERRREIERQMQKYIEMEKELEKQREMEKLIERHRETERQREIERLKKLERQIEKEAEVQRLLQKEMKMRRETQRQRQALTEMATQKGGQLKIDLLRQRQTDVDNKIEVLSSNRGEHDKPCTVVLKTHPATTKITSGSGTLGSTQTLKVTDIQRLPDESSSVISQTDSNVQGEEKRLGSVEGISQKDLEILEFLKKLDELL